MAAYTPPTYYFSGIKFDSSFYVAAATLSGLTQAAADIMYLKKTVPDTASSIIQVTGIIAAGNIQALSATASVDIACNNTLGAINVGLLTASPITIGNTGNTTNHNSTINNFPLSLSIGGNVFKYIPWTAYTMSVRDGSGYNAPLTINGTIFTTSFSVVGNLLYIRHKYSINSTSGSVGSGNYGFSLPSSTDLGFTYAVSSTVSPTTITSGLPDGSCLGDGFVSGLGFGHVHSIMWRNVLTVSSVIVPQLFVFIVNNYANAGTFGWQTSSYFPYNYAPSGNINYSWQASLPITF